MTSGAEKCPSEAVRSSGVCGSTDLQIRSFPHRQSGRLPESVREFTADLPLSNFDCFESLRDIVLRQLYEKDVAPAICFSAGIVPGLSIYYCSRS